MKNLILSTILTVVTIFSFVLAMPVEARVSVHGYSRRSSGTYVQPHYRTSPDHSRFNNWSTKGNPNPYTGKKGYVNPFRYRTK